MNAFELRDIEKHYPGFKLGPLSLAAEPGTVLALIGPNGAGKTTLMDLLAGVLRSTHGQVELFGRAVDANAADAKHAIGYASEQQAFYENWTGAAQGELHQAVSSDFERTSDQLRALGATQIEVNRLSLEDISVHILRSSIAISDPGSAATRSLVSAA